MALGFSGFIYVATIEAKTPTPYQIVNPDEIVTPMPTNQKINPPSLNDPKKELNIVVVMSESQPYELLIVNSFLEHLKSKVKVQNSIIPHQLKNFISPTTEEGEKKWKVFINNIYATYLH